MKNINVVSIKMVKESQLEYGDKIQESGTVAKIAMDYLKDVDREHFVVFCLDIKGGINAINTVSIGTLTASLAHPREVFKAAIVSNSAKIILVHNHPSGDITPSKDDLLLTERLQNAGDILGITVLDHIIIADKKYTSMKETGVCGF